MLFFFSEVHPQRENPPPEFVITDTKHDLYNQKALRGTCQEYCYIKAPIIGVGEAYPDKNTFVLLTQNIGKHLLIRRPFMKPILLKTGTLAGTPPRTTVE